VMSKQSQEAQKAQEEEKARLEAEAERQEEVRIEQEIKETELKELQDSLDPADKTDPGEPEHIETYWKVRFNAKAVESETDDVILIVNGETLIMQRDKEIIIPGRFKECADHAEIPRFRQLPNAPRKVMSPIKVYPYSIIGKSTKKEYDIQKNRGDKQSKQNIKKYGFEVTPDMADKENKCQLKQLVL
jgi:hypothetical protein